ncbi:tetratricopeptide repeat protein [Actinokineospora xionganensis]|uniref:Tetratricopeptide repeat protein n=1 Tax=Actinokineospora xionganensis TaxID=2684470 RepID=A0ABR7L8U1_9PSEU|nr:tetratricopeptide repeat protein [Actinokineospora xionganensis]MBC6448977.1 tetratricopeptide repeat protein [Actinokineospora xionganensis]
MSSTPGRRRIFAVAVIVAGVAVLAASASTLFARPAVPTASAPSLSALDRAVDAAQAKLRRVPNDPDAWARLGIAYVEQARVRADPNYYPKAQGALEKSLALRPERNAEALIGLGALANARHDFTAARQWGEKARAVAPDTAEVYGVLADAYTQLGDAEAATDAVQRMLDLKPGVASFTRAAYDLELRGQVDEARAALERARADGCGAFCDYQLGELAFDTGDLDGAARHYEDGLRADPRDVSLLRGRAKVAAARGQTDDALAGYRDVVSRAPLPEHLHDYALLLTAAGRPEEAAAQFTVLDAQRALAEAAGATDDLDGSVIAADRGDVTTALRLAEAEWGRRHQVLVADAMAWALHLNGRDAEALTFADRAGALGWRNAGLAFHRGMILHSLGRQAEAATALEQALSINPHFSVADAATARQTLETIRAGK